MEASFCHGGKLLTVAEGTTCVQQRVRPKERGGKKASTFSHLSPAYLLPCVHVPFCKIKAP